MQSFLLRFNKGYLELLREEQQSILSSWDVENFIERHYRLKYRFNYIHHYHNINLTFCSINSTFFLRFREEYIPPRASSCTWSDKMILMCAGLDSLVDVACFWWIYKWLLFFVFFVRHKSECPNEQIVDIIIQVLLVSIVHQSKGPLGSHERPDPSDHVAELEGLCREKEYEVDLSSHPKGFTYFLLGRQVGARWGLCKRSTRLHQCCKIYS